MYWLLFNREICALLVSRIRADHYQPFSFSPAKGAKSHANKMIKLGPVPLTKALKLEVLHRPCRILYLIFCMGLVFWGESTLSSPFMHATRNSVSVSTLWKWKLCSKTTIYSILPIAISISCHQPSIVIQEVQCINNGLQKSHLIPFAVKAPKVLRALCPLWLIILEA